MVHSTQELVIFCAFFWQTFEGSVGDLWTTFGRPSGGVGQTFGRALADLWTAFGRPLDDG